MRLIVAPVEVAISTIIPFWENSSRTILLVCRIIEICLIFICIFFGSKLAYNYLQIKSNKKPPLFGGFLLCEGYASIYGISPMNRAFLMAVAKARWLFRETPERFAAIIFPDGVKNFRKSSMSL